MVNRLLKTAIVGLIAAACPAPGIARDGDPVPSHGLAMHGDPAFGPAFSGVDFVRPDAPRGGTLRLAGIGTFDSVHPFIVRGVPAIGPLAPHGRFLNKLVYESLLRRSTDEPFTLYSMIAESVRVAPDRRWIEFTLDNSARFHDGRPVTVEDVLFSFRILRDKGRPNHRLYYGQVARAEAVSERRIRFAFRPGPDGAVNRELPLIVGLMPILPAHHFDDRDFARTTLSPIPGTGPYRISDVQAGRRLTLTRAGDYWGADLPVNRGLFNFETVIVDFYRDATAAFEAFKAGHFDIWAEDDSARWHALAGHPAVAAGDIVMERFESGWPAPMRGFIFNTRRDIFADRAVRTAIGHAFNFTWINRVFLHGDFIRTTSFFDGSPLAARGPAGPAVRAALTAAGAEDEALTEAPKIPPNTQKKSYLRDNFKKAMEILEAAGWSILDGRMTRRHDGMPLNFEILLADPRLERVAQNFARNLARIGVAASIRTVDTAQYRTRVDTYDFDMIVGGWDLSLSPGNELAFYFGSDGVDTPGTRNYMGAADPAIDALIERIVNAASRSDLIAAARALDRVLLAGDYLVPLYHAGGQWVARRGDVARPDRTPLEGHLLEAWWKRENRSPP